MLPLPPPAVLAAFGATGEVVRLPLGQGTTARVGDLVLKPVQDAQEAAFVADVCAGLEGEGFRVPRPVCATTGAWVVRDWAAWTFVEGRHDFERRAETIQVCFDLHAALGHVGRPDFLDARADPWAIADRVAWQEIPPDCHETVAAPVRRLMARYRPLDAPAQLIHGDFGGENVLFHDGLPPAVIDFALYWRSVGFAAAIPLVDAVVWEGAPLEALALLEIEDADQYLLRAEVRRLVEIDGHARIQGAHRLDDVAAHAALVDVLAG